jgi:hypothetical protein
MKKTRLLEIIREEIAGALDETFYKLKNPGDERKGYEPQINVSGAPEPEILSKYKKLAEEELEEDTLNEVPDFGGQLDQGVAAKYGEEDTLQKAVDEIVDETLKDMGITLEDLKKDKDKATETLNSIRDKVLGAKRKNIPQDPRVIKALEKQQDIEIDKLGSISGKDLQSNQTNNAIKKALGIIAPGKKGPKGPTKPKAEKLAKEKAPKAEKTPKTRVATRTKGDDGFDTVSYVDKEEAKAAAAAEKADKALGGKYAANLSSEDESNYESYKSDITSLVNDLENKYDKSKMEELKLYLEDSEVRRLFKAKGVKLSDLVRSVVK